MLNPKWKVPATAIYNKRGDIVSRESQPLANQPLTGSPGPRRSRHAASAIHTRHAQHPEYRPATSCYTGSGLRGCLYQVGPEPGTVPSFPLLTAYSVLRAPGWSLTNSPNISACRWTSDEAQKQRFVQEVQLKAWPPCSESPCERERNNALCIVWRVGRDFSGRTRP